MHICKLFLKNIITGISRNKSHGILHPLNNINKQLQKAHIALFQSHHVEMEVNYISREEYVYYLIHTWQNVADGVIRSEMEILLEKAINKEKSHNALRSLPI